MIKKKEKKSDLSLQINFIQIIYIYMCIIEFDIFIVFTLYTVYINYK